MSLSDVKSNPIKREDVVDFKVIVAIDFGTHGTGLGFAVLNNDEKKEGEIYIEQDWCSCVDNKNKTDILLKANGNFKAFGEAALELYMNQGDETDSDENSDTDSDSDEKENKFKTKDMLFESFKMALYDGDLKNGSNGDIKNKIACQDGRLYSTSVVFIAALKFIRNHIFKVFSDKKIQIKSIDDIQWILTVPAIWSDRAKHKMDTWAQRAGLINKNIYNHLRIVYEPDCASISCQYDIINNANNKSLFGIGERYILIDAGGGTADIAWHQVKAEYSMEEVHHCTGGPWGSDYIDGHFDKLLIEIFGQHSIKSFIKQQPANYTKIKNNFRKAKMSFYNKPKENWHKMSLTHEFINEIPQDNDISFNNIINNAKPFGIERGNLKMDGDIFYISFKIWTKCLFDKVIDPMIQHVEEMIPKINNTKDKNGNIKTIKYLCIAGGLASSKYFQHRIHGIFGMDSKYKLSIRIPARPILSVIDGALKLGLKPNYIKTRRLKYTYGISVDRSQKNVDLNKLPKGYLDTNGYIHPNTHKRTVKNLFSKWVSKNDPVDIDEKIVKQYRRFHKKEKTAKLSIYCSSKIDPYIVEGNPLAEVTIPFPDKYNGLSFLVEFYFGSTKIHAKVLYNDQKNNNQNDDRLLINENLELKYETV